MKNFKIVRVRFAPSPTGPLHIGGLRTALYNYLFAKKKKGIFLLRIEDTDKKRLIKKSIKYIINSLKWCNIKYNEGYKKGGIYKPYIQSKRINIYRKYVNILLKKKLAYYCFEKKKKILYYKNNNKNFIYNCLNRKYLKNSLTLKKKKIKYYIKKKKYVIRLKLPKNKNIIFFDKVYGKININTNKIDDKIIFRSNNTPTYYLASVIDDYLMKITHIIRGREWLYSTPIHIIIYKYLKWKLPIFIHLPLILNEKNGKKISKRNNNNNNNKFPIYPIKSKFFNIKNNFKDKGFLPESLFNILALLGWSPPTNKKEILNEKNIIKLFNIKKINKSDLHINYKKMCWINKNYIFKNKKKIFFLLKKYLKKIKKNKIYKNKNIKKIINLIIKRLYFLNIKNIWENSFYFFLKPEKYDIYIYNKLNIKKKKKIKIFLIKIIKLLLNNKKKKIINNLIKKKYKYIYLKILRLIIVGSLKGIELNNIIYIIKKKEIINRIIFFLKKIN